MIKLIPNDFASYQPTRNWAITPLSMRAELNVKSTNNTKASKLKHNQTTLNTSKKAKKKLSLSFFIGYRPSKQEWLRLHLIFTRPTLLTSFLCNTYWACWVLKLYLKNSVHNPWLFSFLLPSPIKVRRFFIDQFFIFLIINLRTSSTTVILSWLPFGHLSRLYYLGLWKS